MNGAAPHHHWGGQILKHTQCCAVSSDVALSTERGASHLRARCARCDHTSERRAAAAAPCPSTAPPSPTSWLGVNLASLLLLWVSLGRGLKMPFSSTSTLQHSLCRRARFSSPAAGMLRTERCQHAAWFSVVRVSTRRSFALDEGSLLQGALCTQA